MSQRRKTKKAPNEKAPEATPPAAEMQPVAVTYLKCPRCGQYVGRWPGQWRPLQRVGGVEAALSPEHVICGCPKCHAYTAFAPA